MRRINDAKLLDTLQKRILDFHTSHQKSLQELNRKVDALNLSMDDIKEILKQAHNSSATSSGSVLPRLRAAIPANTSIFHGRDALVAKLVGVLTSNVDGQKRPHVCLLGPGGMGKTSTALAVMADPKMRKHFPEKNQIWVPCVKATSLSLFLDTLYSSLGATQNSGDTLSDIISEIKSSSEPLVILLDNFETPWNVEESRSEIEQILEALDQIVHITIFITMRSSIPPCDGKHWQSFKIEEVDEEAARQIYLDVCPAGCNDGDLLVLLKSLGCMPLAITLMAKLAKTTGLGADKLLENYQRKGTMMLGHGVDAKHSLDICIGLSVESPPIIRCPQAYTLLVSLAMLPVGTTYDTLNKWWAPDFPDLLGALQILSETALIQWREAHYFVLPVIRSYILDSDPSRFPSDARGAMITSACHFLEQHNSSPGDPSYKEHAQALSVEEGNLQAILLSTTNPEPGLVEAFLVLAEHQLSLRPRLEVIEHVLKLAQMENNPILVGNALTCHGKLLLRLDHCDDALKQHTDAHKTFLGIPNEQLAARSLLQSVEVYLYMDTGQLELYQKKLDLVMKAKTVFEQHNDGPGIALSLFYFGAVKGQHGYQTEGINSLNRAWELFQDYGDALYVAKCLYLLETVYYWSKRYDEALKAGKAAIQQYEDLGQYSGEQGVHIRMLGKILFMKGDYTAAFDLMIGALGTCKSYGCPADIAHTLEIIGRIWIKMDQQENAQGAYKEAISDVRARAGLKSPGLGRALPGQGLMISQARPIMWAWAGLGRARA